MTIKKTTFVSLFLLSLTPWVTAPVALAAGVLFSLLAGNPMPNQSSIGVKWLLKVAVVALGFGMNLFTAVKAGKDGLMLTVGTIAFVLLLGSMLGKLFKNDRETSYLVSSGTAICGGSAIAAVAPIIGANQKQISVAMGTVFILNAVALVLFPVLGHALGLTQYEFGLWSAIAIHDTSSVVGAASVYGDRALEVATTVKLGRALWIIPLSLLTVWLGKKSGGKIAIPYFIFLFIGAMALSTFLPQFSDVYALINLAAKRLLVATLFLVGSGITVEAVKSVGVRVFAQGAILWLMISLVSLAAILILN